MAEPSTKNVGARKPMVGGGVYYVKGTTALPTDASTDLSAEIKAGALGYVSEDGIQPTRETNVEKVKAWGGDVVAALLDDETSSFEFTLLETFAEAVNKFVYGEDNVTVTAATTTAGKKIDITDKGGTPERGVFVFDMRNGANRERVVVPVGDAVISGEEPWVDGGLTAYQVQVEALKDSSGVRVYRYLENDERAAAATV